VIKGNFLHRAAINQKFEYSLLGWHIAMVEDRREARPMSLDVATPVIRRKLEQQAIQRHLSALLGSAEIEVLVGAGQAE